MGDSLPRRLSVSIPPSLAGSSISPVLPLHEARGEEGRLRRLSQGQALGRSGYELEPLRTSHEEEDEEGAGEEEGMPYKKSKSRSPNPRTFRSSQKDTHDRADSQSTGISPIENAHLNSNGDMNGSFRERVGKHTTSLDIDGDSERQTARLMGQSSFSLDNAPPITPAKEERSKGFFELPEQDRRNFLLLVLLYFLQGIPMGLASGSVPFLLKSHLSYGQIGVYSLASYPYSLKLLWSPIVDAVWSSKVGRRKSWILPIQTLSGLGMLWLGSRAQQMMELAGENDGAGVWGFTGWWFGLVFMCATQDIAVDGTIYPLKCSSVP